MITININGLKWNIFFMSPTHPKLSDADAYGITHFRECEIYIDDGLPAGHKRQIITHELVHALAFSYCESIDMENEETICGFIAAHLDELKSLQKTVLKSI